MTDTIEAVADLLYPAINGPREAAVAIARQAIAAHTKALIEGAGELCTALKFHGRYGSENRDQMTVRKNGERDQAAATIAAQKAEIERLTEREAQAKLDCVRAGIEAAKAALKDETRSGPDDTWSDGWEDCWCAIRALDAEVIAKGEG